jgi:hypothetical protein
MMINLITKTAIAQYKKSLDKFRCLTKRARFDLLAISFPSIGADEF